MTTENAKIKNLIFYSIIAVLFAPLVSPLFLAPLGIILFPDAFAKAIFLRIVIEIIFALAIFSILKKPVAFKIKPLFWAFLFLWLIMTVSTFASPQPHQSWWDLQYRSLGFFFYSHLFILLFIIIYFIKDEKMWDRIFTVIISIGGVVSAIGILQWFGVYFKAAYITVGGLDRPGATLGNPNTFGAYLVILLPITLLYLLRSLKKRPLFNIGAVFFGVIFALEIGGLAVANSRAAILGFIASLIIFTLLYNFQKTWIKKAAFSALIFLIIFSIAGIKIGFLKDTFIFNRFASLISSSGATRLTAWQSGLKSFLDRPFFGFGPENFAIAFDRNYNPFFGTMPGLDEHWWGRAHNFIIEWLTTLGIIGFAAYLSVYGYMFFHLNHIRKEIKNSNSAATATMLISVFAGYFTYSFFNFDTPAVLTLIFILWGYSYFLISGHSEATTKIKTIILPKIAKYGLISVLFILILVFWRYNLKPFIVNARANKAEVNYLNNPEKFFNDYIKITEKSGYIEHDLNLRFYSSAIKYANWLSQNGKIEDSIAKRKILIGLLEKNLQIQQYYTRDYLFLGDSYSYLITLENKNKTENFAKARNYYLKAIELSPERQEGQIGLAHLYRIAGQYDEAIKILLEIIALNDRYGPAHLWLAINYFYKNEIEIGIKELKKVLNSGYDLPLENLQIMFKNKPETLKKILEGIK
ncbi:MAG: O-antigen ligase family protein [Patescibacteria group bacterium]